MPRARKRIRYKYHEPADAKTLAGVAHRMLFPALQSYRRQTAFEPEKQASYEDIFSMAESFLDDLPIRQLIPAAHEHLLRTGCSPVDTEAAWDVARHTARVFLVALLYDQQKYDASGQP
jgi:hypothetical protein